jgi:hypothetical protein
VAEDLAEKSTTICELSRVEMVVGLSRDGIFPPFLASPNFC